VRVAEPPEQPEAALEERPRTIVVSRHHEIHREPVERPRNRLLLAEAFVHGQGLSKEPLRLRVVPARPSHQRESRVRLRHALRVLE
jgi:hypothetical protein